jgi:hypothetical protein
MAEGGFDLRTWVAVIGVFVLFFGVPAATIALDMRKKRRQEAREHTVAADVRADR